MRSIFMSAARGGAICAALCAVFAGGAAHAGRPLSTDDAATADAGTCQLESWVETVRRRHSLVLAPACGVSPGLELGADYTLPHPRDAVREEAGIGLKWARDDWRIDSALGPVNLGLKLIAALEHPNASGWRHATTGALALATWKADDSWTFHLNFGAARSRLGGTTAALLKVAAVWAPFETVAASIETEANNRRARFGGTVNSAGLRWWLDKDRFAVDLSASRQAGVAVGSLWTVGFGWYALGI